MNTMKFSKRDVLFLSILLLLSLAGFVIVAFFHGKEGAEVIVSVDNQLIGSYELSIDQEIPIEIDGETGNVLRIENHKASMVHATCPDKLCVHQKSISRQGETIVCLPHKVVVEVRSKEQAELDSFVR